MLPCSVVSGPTIAAASSSGIRQSTPTASAMPPRRMSARNGPVPTPKWMRGTSMPSSATREWGATYSRNAARESDPAHESNSCTACAPPSICAARKARETWASHPARRCHDSGSACIIPRARRCSFEGPPSTR